MSNESVMMTVEDVQNFLGIGRNRAYDIFRRKDFPAILIGKKYIVEQSAFYSWLQERREKEIA